ncbi:hypothetical protein MTO96_044362, partial [Rhipicephalus appendiculatus]
EDDSGACTTKDDVADSMSEAAEKPQCDKRVPIWSDMYIATALIPSYKTLRNAETGSWFLSAVFTVFSEHATLMHLEALMQQVHVEILRKSSQGGRSRTPSVQVHGWTKVLYFNPRLYFRVE